MALFTVDASFMGQQAIASNTTITNPLAVIANVPTGVIPTLQVFLNIQHTFNGDLDVSLSNPDGTSVELFTDVGAGSDGFFVNLSDLAPTDIGTATAPVPEAGIRGAFNP